MTRIQLAVLGCVLGAGCTAAAPETSTTTAAATGPAIVTTDATSYHYATEVVVSWSGLGGNAKDWIALAPVGAPMTETTRWAYVGGAASGTLGLEGPVPGGMYVARAFDNDTYNLMGESDPFAVADVSDTHATIALDRANYAIDTPITVSWTGMPAGAIDWVSIAPPGRADNVAAIWLYTGGAQAGTVTFPKGMSIASMVGFPGGDYVARIYLNGTYTKVAETPPVLIGSRVTTDAATYAPSAPITVSWTHLPGATGDWVALAPANAKPDSVLTWVYTDGSQNGSTTFAAGLAAPGTYVARTFAPDTYYISGESAAFTVTAGTGATLTTDASAYVLDQPITVTWSGLSTNAHDWIAIAPAGSTDTTVSRWVYTAGAAAGSFVFEGPAATGGYVARAFSNDTYVKIVESAPFQINTVIP